MMLNVQVAQFMEIIVVGVPMVRKNFPNYNYN